MCADCGHRLELELRLDQWNDPPPPCPQCDKVEIDLDFRPIALGGSLANRAMAYAEKIAAEDYQVADMQLDSREGGRPKVRYQEPKELKEAAAKVAREASREAHRTRHAPSNWSPNPAAAHETLLKAVAIGREARLMSGGKSGLEILQDNIRNGTEPDKIANSKKLSAKIW